MKIYVGRFVNGVVVVVVVVVGYVIDSIEQYSLLFTMSLLIPGDPKNATHILLNFFF